MKTPSLTPDELFTASFYSVSQGIYKWAESKGFWEDGIERNKGELIALMHSELSEALEAIRSPAGGGQPDEHCPGFGSLEIELADCIIRIMDFSAGFGLRVGDAVIEKMKYNMTRPHKHGKKF